MIHPKQKKVKNKCSENSIFSVLHKNKAPTIGYIVIKKGRAILIALPSIYVNHYSL